jgi:hypothetical protein
MVPRCTVVSQRDGIDKQEMSKTIAFEPLIETFYRHGKVAFVK